MANTPSGRSGAPNGSDNATPPSGTSSSAGSGGPDVADRNGRMGSADPRGPMVPGVRSDCFRVTTWLNTRYGAHLIRPHVGEPVAWPEACAQAAEAVAQIRTLHEPGTYAIQITKTR